MNFFSSIVIPAARGRDMQVPTNLFAKQGSSSAEAQGEEVPKQ